MNNLVQQINTDIIVAMKAKDNTTLRGLRSVKAAFATAASEKNATTIEVNGVKQIDDNTAIKILTKLSTQRKESGEIYFAAGRTELAQIEAEDFETIKKYLPDTLSESELTDSITEILNTIDAPNVNAKIGKCLGELNKKFPGRINVVLAKQILNNLVK